jgi:hypothetical protein
MCSSKNTQEPVSDALNIDLSSIPYALFTKNFSEMPEEEFTQLSKYTANIMYLIDVGDTCDKKGITYIAELFAFKCSNIKLGSEVNASVDELLSLIPGNHLVGIAYDMSGCNDTNFS